MTFDLRSQRQKIYIDFLAQTFWSKYSFGEAKKKIGTKNQS